MELRQFLSVFIDQKNLFCIILISPLVFVLIYTLNKPISYQSNLTLTVIRSEGSNDSNNPYNDEYDSYYRFSADEKFTQTIGQWLVSPSITDTILTQSNVPTQSLSADDLSEEFSVSQRSPQVINVQYNSLSPEVATAKAIAVTQTLNQLTDQLNSTVKSESWFIIQADNPLTRKVTINLPLLVSSSLIVGFCLAVLGTLFRFYYLKEK